VRSAGTEHALQIAVDDELSVSALAIDAPAVTAALVLAHGAGAGMTHPFMQALAEALAARRIATLRFQFPYMQAGSKRPDPPVLCHRTVRSAVAVAAERWPALPLFAGGKSFGGRMTSQAQAIAPLAHVHGLVFFGFPLHPAGKPSSTRAEHLLDIRCPLLFLQGSRDKLAELPLLTTVLPRLSAAHWHVIDAADHAFHVPARTGRTDAEVVHELAQHTALWMTDQG
jgi:predicted alpha/beta-hydrolase family hydrolase